MSLIEKVVTQVKRYGISSVTQRVLQNKIYPPLDRLCMGVMKRLTKNKPLQDTIILESHNDFDTNGGGLYRYLIAQGHNRNYRIVWFLRNKKPKNLPENVLAFNMFRPSFRKAYYLCTAKIISIDHVFPPKVRNDQKLFYLTHGPFCLKAVSGKVCMPEGLDYYLCPSKAVAEIHASQLGQDYPNKRELILGFPVHDVLYSQEKGDLHKLTDKAFSKVLLWMPTFRRSKVHLKRIDSKMEQPMGIPIIEDEQSYQALNSALAKENALLIIKIHPMQDLTYVKVKSLSNILVLDGMAMKRFGIDNYRLMKDTDALISDYSSAANDYLHTGKPVAYTMDDAGCFGSGFIVDDVTTMTAGPFIRNQEDFWEFVKQVLSGEDAYREKRQQLLKTIFDYRDGNSAQRLCRFMGIEKE